LKKAVKRKKVRLARVAAVTARVVFFFSVLGIGLFAFYYCQNALETGSHFVLESIEYKGGNRFDQEAFSAFLLKNFDRNLISLDIQHVRALVEGETWVRRGLVRRKLPNTLIIQLVEREPAAVAVIDNELYVVDEEGVVLDAFGPAYDFLDQPIVKGLRNVAREESEVENAHRMSLYLSVVTDLRDDSLDYTHTISEIDVENPERIAVIPSDDPVSIYLGKDLFRKRYEVFLSQKQLYLRLKEKYGLIEYVDVTYDNKIIFHTPNKAVVG
jgi:cell division septal protein FtsQ